jgi:hypothetical protein
MDAYKKRHEAEEYGHHDRDDDPDGQPLPPTDPAERRSLLKERFKGD